GTLAGVTGVRGLLGVEARGDPLEVLGHGADEEDDRDQEDDHQQQADRGRLAEVLTLTTGVLLLREHGGRRHRRGRHRRGQRHELTFSRTPANRSSSGTVLSTNDRASSYS